MQNEITRYTPEGADSPQDQSGDATPPPAPHMEQRVPASESGTRSQDDIDDLVYRLNMAVAHLRPPSVGASETTAPPQYDNIA